MTALVGAVLLLTWVTLVIGIFSVGRGAKNSIVLISYVILAASIVLLVGGITGHSWVR